MQEEEKKTVDIDTSGPEVDVQLPEEKTEEVVEQPTNTCFTNCLKCLEMTAIPSDCLACTCPFGPPCQTN